MDAARTTLYISNKIRLGLTLMFFRGELRPVCEGQPAVSGGDRVFVVQAAVPPMLSDNTGGAPQGSA